MLDRPYSDPILRLYRPFYGPVPILYRLYRSYTDPIPTLYDPYPGQLDLFMEFSASQGVPQPGVDLKKYTRKSLFKATNEAAGRSQLTM